MIHLTVQRDAGIAAQALGIFQHFLKRDVVDDRALHSNRAGIDHGIEGAV